MQSVAEVILKQYLPQTGTPETQYSFSVQRHKLTLFRC